MSATMQKWGTVVVLVVVVIVAALTFPHFATLTNAQDLTVAIAFLGIASIGQAFVVITGGLDLSVGSMMALGGVVAALAAPMGWPVALLLPLLVGAAVGLLHGVLIARVGLAPFIVTLAGLLGLRGAALALSGENNVPITDGGLLTWLATGDVLGVRMPVVLLVGMFAVAAVVLNRTRYGGAVFAVGGSERAAVMMGVRVVRVKAAAYVMSGALSGLAGALTAALLAAGQPTSGQGYELQTIAAVVVGGVLLTGGVGTMSGVLAGVLLLGVIQNVLNQVGTLDAYMQYLVNGCFLIVAVALQRLLSLRKARPA